MLVFPTIIQLCLNLFAGAPYPPFLLYTRVIHSYSAKLFSEYYWSYFTNDFSNKTDTEHLVSSLQY